VEQEETDSWRHDGDFLRALPSKAEGALNFGKRARVTSPLSLHRHRSIYEAEANAALMDDFELERP